MTVWPLELQDVPFDNDAAFRATWAIDETIRRVTSAAEYRSRLGADILCRCHGPFAEHLQAELDGAARQATWLIERLRTARMAIGDAIDAARMEQVRRELRRADWLEAQQPAPAADGAGQ